MVKVCKSKAEIHAAGEGGKLIVLDCFATWCPPCRMIAPEFHKMETENPDVAFVQIDVDDSSDVAQELAIEAMPTFVYFKNGKEVHRVVGADPRSIRAAIAQHK